MEKLSLLILAGGRSRRMGQDKLWLMLDGMPLIEHVVRRVLPLAAEVLLSAADAQPFAAFAGRLCAEGVPARVVSDVYAGAGPLAGLHAGLAAAQHDLVLALAGDMPFVNEVLLRHMIALAEGFDAVAPLVPHPQTGELAWEPLHALYRRSCLSAVTARLAAGERRVQSFFPDVRVRAVPAAELARYDPAGLSLFNVNTPEDWQRARGSVLPGALSSPGASRC